MTESRDPRGPGRIFATVSRLIGLLVVACCLGPGIAISAAQDLPRTDRELIERIRTAIDAKDYAPIEELVYWEGAGKIKRNIVAFEIRRGLGRKISAITVEDFPVHGMDGLKAIEQLRLNMPVTHRVRVTYAEPPINDQGKLPTSVFLVGKREGAYRIALVVRNIDDDDD